MLRVPDKESKNSCQMHAFICETSMVALCQFMPLHVNLTFCRHNSINVLQAISEYVFENLQH